MPEMILASGECVLIDEADYPLVSQFRWQIHRTNSKTYVRRRYYEGGKHRVMLLHRFIMAPEPGKQVDHINHDPLDNRRCNLRICSQQDNKKNKRIYRNNRSGYKGVHQVNRRWRAQIRVNGLLINIGYFKRAVNAAKAYDRFARRYHGDFACLNFP